MDRGLFLAVSSMRSAERRIEFVANNLANLNTHGFKRSEAAFQGFLVRNQYGLEHTVGVRGRQDFSQGNVQPTGNPFHVALRGPGFFAVESPDGEVYTRDGNFGVNAQGELVNDLGWPVAWAQRLAAYDPAQPELTIEPNGEVHQGTTRLGRLEVADFADYSDLTELDRGLWVAKPEAERITAAAELSQGALEGSNATAVEEMVELIASQRAYELSARLVKSLDDIYQRLYRPR